MNQRRGSTLYLLAVLVAALVAAAVSASGLSEPPVSRYYPQVPGKITSPEMAVRAYFDALSFASNLTEAEMAAAGGSVGSKDPYRTAYSYWSSDWRTKHTYQEFLDSWKSTANIQLMRLLPAGTADGRIRFFAEAKSIEAVGQTPRFGIFHYYGFFEVRSGPTGWAIVSGSLEPESPLFRIAGHQPWRGDPEMVARQALSSSGETPPDQAKVAKNADSTVTVQFGTPDTKQSRSVVLAQRADGIWEILRK